MFLNVQVFHYLFKGQIIWNSLFILFSPYALGFRFRAFYVVCISYSTLDFLLCLTVYCGDILFCWRSLFIQATTECYIQLDEEIQYDEEISKKCRSVRPPVRLSVCNANKKAHSSFIIDSRKIIRISDERVWHPLQENEAIFSEK